MYIARWKIAAYALILLLGIASALPNLLTHEQLARLPAWVGDSRVSLGLDLKGGAHLALEVDGKALVSERLDTLSAEARQLLTEAGLPAEATVVGDALVIEASDATRQAEVRRALGPLVAPGGLSQFGQAQSELALAELDDGAIQLSLTEAGLRDRLDAAVAQSLEIVRRRIDEVGVVEPTVQRIGPDRILVQLPGVQDPSRIKDLLGTTAKLTLHRVAPGGDQRPGLVTLPAVGQQLRYTVERRPVLSGERLVDASAGFDRQIGQPIVSFRFDTIGARRFADYTRDHVGSALAIVLDGAVLSAPVIQEAIPGGSGQIDGHFTVEEASDLAALLRAGALPVPLTVVEERTVGPELGRDAVEMGVYTGLAGFLLVVAFMVALYRSWGLIASLALMLNLALTFGALSLLGATLTLPGIAGIVLGIGLAVDANVLINERIREETRKGLSAFAALDTGFKRAFATIVDSNVTTLIATTLLFLFGTGPVRGFAVTMGLGILISMLTAVSFVRAVMVELVRRRRVKVLRIEPLLRLFPDGTSIRFMRARFLGIALSGLLSLASIVLFIQPGLNYGVDFRGGIQVEVANPRAIDLEPLRGRLDGLGLGEVTLQSLDDSRALLVRLERQPGGDAAQNQALTTLQRSLRQALPDAEILRSEVVGPKVSGELAQTGLIAVALASLAMLAYIWLRFEWPFAVGAIATLLLDVTKLVGFFALTGLNFNLTAIAALLTLIGYSVNDKVVVYDRMRENLRRYKQTGLRDVIDRSINETLARSLYTSVTAFLAILPMAVWGGVAVESFAIPMLVGIVIAASSSIFIAAPILLFLGDWRTRRRIRMAAASPATNTAGEELAPESSP